MRRARRATCQDHLDGRSPAPGLVSSFESNPGSVLRAHANRLKSSGL